MKIAPIIRAIKNHNEQHPNKIDYLLVHTGQHYDDKLSKVFFDDLGIPNPDFNLGAGSGTQAEQTGKIMVAFESFLQTNPVDLVLVVGDVTSTMACTIVAKKKGIKVAHVEAGIRSFDMTMPEEINRIVTDSLADYFFTTSEYANNNLISTGVNSNQIFFVGNTMIDTLYFTKDKLVKPPLWEDLKLEEKKYALVTLHRPSNVDDVEHLEKLLNQLNEACDGVKLIFPVHPRTLTNFEKVIIHNSNIFAIEPQSYLSFIYLLKHSLFVVTDSGGIQEESTVLGIPCLTLRNNTERPETIQFGTNELIGDDTEKLFSSIKTIKSGQWKKGKIPMLWDGETAKRIVEKLNQLI